MMKQFLRIDDWVGDARDPRISIESSQIVKSGSSGMNELHVVLDFPYYVKRKHDQKMIVEIMFRNEPILHIMLMEVPRDLFISSNGYMDNGSYQQQADDATRWIGTFFWCRIINYQELPQSQGSLGPAKVHASFCYTHFLANLPIPKKK